MAIVVSGRKIHFAVDAAGIRAQFLFNQTHRFNELAPVHCRQKAETGDAIADRDLRGGLALGFRLNQLFDRQVRFRERLLNPGQRQS